MGLKAQSVGGLKFSVSNLSFLLQVFGKLGGIFPSMVVTKWLSALASLNVAKFFFKRTRTLLEAELQSGGKHFDLLWSHLQPSSKMPVLILWSFTIFSCQVPSFCLSA